MGGATSIVGSGGQPGLLRNLVPQPNWSTFVRGDAAGAPGPVTETRR